MSLLPRLPPFKKIEGALNVLKVALAIVLMGGASAFTAGKMAVANVQAEVTAHIAMDTAVHTVFAQQADRVEKTVNQAAYDAQWARINTEALLRAQGIQPPPPPTRPDAGARNDGGR